MAATELKSQSADEGEMDESQRPAVRRTWAANGIVGSLLVLAVAVPLVLGWNIAGEHIGRAMLYGGLPFAVLAMGAELVVRRQMSLARTGVHTPGTFVSSECEVLSRRDWAKIPAMVITYEYFAPAGRRCTGTTRNAGAFGPGFGKSVLPEIVYDPVHPPRHMMIDDMWAVNWREESSAERDHGGD